MQNLQNKLTSILSDIKIYALISASSIVPTGYSLCKPFLSEYTKDRIKIFGCEYIIICLTEFKIDFIYQCVVIDDRNTT